MKKKISFFSKAQNLEYLNYLKIRKISIPKFYYFNIKSWKKNKNYIISLINQNFENKICIRSSFMGEDSSNKSMAGKFESFINIENKKKSL